MSFSLTPVTQVETSGPAWIWTNRVARGTLTILEGDPGTNKSTIVYDLAARISAGLPMPDCAAPSPFGEVWMVSTEDSAARTRATLAACGADLEKVNLIRCDGGFRLPSSLADLETAVKRGPPVLLTLDPLSECIDGATTSERSVRAALTPLCQLAQKYGFGILGLRHLRKAQSSNMLYRGGGSIGLVALSRSTLLAMEDPFQTGQRLLVQVKSSLGPIWPAIAFKAIAQDSGLKIDWLGPTGYSTEQLVAAQRTTEAKALEEAAYVLYSVLGDGPLPARDALALGRKSGVSDRTLRRAKDLLKVRSERRGFGPGSEFFWILPERDELISRLREHDMDRLMQQLLGGEDELPTLRPPPEPLVGPLVDPKSPDENYRPPASFSGGDEGDDDWWKNS